jgi:hypothetical protein
MCQGRISTNLDGDRTTLGGTKHGDAPGDRTVSCCAVLLSTHSLSE